MPDERLSSLHITIEYAVAHTLPKHKNLQDKDIEWVFEQYRNYFQAVRQGKMVAEPDSTRSGRSALMDYLWECLIKWEEAGGPELLLDGSFQPAGRPVTQVEELYVMGFNDLRKSCRLHRREDGPRGYVKHVQEWVAQILARDPDLIDLLDPEIPALQSSMNFQLLLEKRGYHISLENDETGIPAIDDFFLASAEVKQPPIAKIQKLLIQYPDNHLLRGELASALWGADKKEESIGVWKALVAEKPDHPFHQSAYLDSLMKFDEEVAVAEIKRLGFRHDLSAYPFDLDDRFSLTALLSHTSASIHIKLNEGDTAYALELLDDLVNSGLPKQLLASHGAHFLLITLDSEINDGKETITEEDYRRFPQAMELINEMLRELQTSLGSDGGGNYPAGPHQLYPWPRDAAYVDRALQLRVHLIGSDPEIFRTIVVPDDTLLPDLHGMLQVAFDWEESHLHEFIQGDTHYGTPDPEGLDNEVDYRTVRVGHLLKNVGDIMTYLYDFGDSWKHHIVLEAIPEVDDEILYPRCIAGARRGPAEDSGGIHGYQRLLKILEDPTHPEYDEFQEWLPGGFDPAEFVLAWTHKQLWKGRFWHLGAEE